MEQKIITLKEYESVSVEAKLKEKQISNADFKDLRDYHNIANSGEKDYNIFKIDPRSKIIKAQNYVGYLQTKGKLGLEILPKIDLSGDNEKTKVIFLKMLQVFWGFNVVKDSANLDLTKMSIWESLIAIFLVEMDKLLKQGVLKGYESIKDNLPVFKGRLLFNQHLRYNFADKSRFYMQFDQYTANRPENKLLKSCLKFLLKASLNTKNQQKIRQQLTWFSEVDYSNNYDYDLQISQKNHLLKRYYPLLDWCHVFLKHKSFSAFSGDNMAISLLFPMERVFESYISYCIKKYQGDFKVTRQSNSKSFCTKNHKPIFRLIPDLKLKKDGKITVLDMKWKKLNSKAEGKSEIQESDLYQLFTYSRVLKSDPVFLIYPKPQEDCDHITLKFNVDKNPECICYFFNLGKCLTEEKAKKETQKLINFLDKSINKEKKRRKKNLT